MVWKNIDPIKYYCKIYEGEIIVAVESLQFVLDMGIWVKERSWKRVFCRSFLSDCCSCI